MWILHSHDAVLRRARSSLQQSSARTRLLDNQMELLVQEAVDGDLLLVLLLAVVVFVTGHSHFARLLLSFTVALLRE